MSLTLVPPNVARRRPYYRVRGTYLGVRVDRSTETSDKTKARQFLKGLETAIERGAFSERPQLTLAAAITSYVQAGGENRFLAPILKHFGKGALAADIDQASADAAAAAIYPTRAMSTRNRQFYTPLLAVLHHAKLTPDITRPRGASGTARTVFLNANEIERVLAEAMREDAEFGALLTVLCYTGLRLSEGLRIRCEDVRLDEQVMICGTTKNGLPRGVYIPPRVVTALANHPRGLDRAGKVFRWSKGSALYLLAERVYFRAGVDHGGAPFHVHRHTYGAHMTRGGADLVATGAWKSATAARVYQHFDVTDEARKADAMPGSGALKRARRGRKTSTP